MVYRIIFLLLVALLHTGQRSWGQTDSDTIDINCNEVSSDFTHEFFVSGGYNRCRYNFFDAGMRYYHWKNDGQTILAFSGIAAGCEFSVREIEQIYIPYIGWQGQIFLLGYGLRAEYAISEEKHSVGITPELGLSFFEFLRITGAYRFDIDSRNSFDLDGFRFSVIAALPLSFFKSKD